MRISALPITQSRASRLIGLSLSRPVRCNLPPPPVSCHTPGFSTTTTTYIHKGDPVRMCLRSHSKTPFASPHCKTLHMPSSVASQHPSAPILEFLGIPCFSHDWEPVIAATAASGPEAGPDGIRPGRGAQVESPPAHTSHPPPTIAEPLRELCTTTRMTYISPFALFPCWLVCHIHTSVKTNPTRTGRQIVADESLFGTEGEASSISSLALMRRPVDGSGNEALHSLPPPNEKS